MAMRRERLANAVGNRPGRRARRLAAAAVGLIVVLSSACIPYDFEGSIAAEITWVERDGTWHNNVRAEPIWSGPYSEVIVPEDYDGYGKWDPAVIVGGDWVTGGARGTISFPAPPVTGRWPAVPVSADYDGDHDADPAWYRSQDATWWIEGAPGPITLGRPDPTSAYSADVPVPGDWDHDGRDEPAVCDPRTGAWSNAAGTFAIAGGLSHQPAPADYDGDLYPDVATLTVAVSPTPYTYFVPGRAPISFRSSEPYWYAHLAPAPADYDGDGRADPAAAPGPNPQQWRIWNGSAVTTFDAPADSFPVNLQPMWYLTMYRVEVYASQCIVYGSC